MSPFPGPPLHPTQPPTLSPLSASASGSTQLTQPPLVTAVIAASARSGRHRLRRSLNDQVRFFFCSSLLVPVCVPSLTHFLRYFCTQFSLSLDSPTAFDLHLSQHSPAPLLTPFQLSPPAVTVASTRSAALPTPPARSILRLDPATGTSVQLLFCCLYFFLLLIFVPLSCLIYPFFSFTV